MKTNNKPWLQKYFEADQDGILVQNIDKSLLKEKSLVPMPPFSYKFWDKDKHRLKTHYKFMYPELWYLQTGEKLVSFVKYEGPDYQILIDEDIYLKNLQMYWDKIEDEKEEIVMDLEKRKGIQDEDDDEKMNDDD